MEGIVGPGRAEMTFEDEVEALGLCRDAVLRHQSIVSQIETISAPIFKIIDTCRLENQRLHRLCAWSRQPDISGVWAFVPAAGASTRYSQPVRDWVHQPKRRPSKWALGPELRKLLEQPELLLASLSRPKALLPCVGEGLSFLDMKVAEHREIPVSGQVIVSPGGWSEEFERCLGGDGAGRLPYLRVEQGPELSTVRFRDNGEPARDSQGHLSMVPAGHGALVDLFPRLREQLASLGVHSIWIRNIDNVGGVGESFQTASRRFLATHCVLLEHMKKIRIAIEAARYEQASSLARSIFEVVGSVRNLGYSEDKALATRPARERPIWHLLLAVFQLPAHICDKRSRVCLLDAVRRPVNTMGMVPNTGKDVGGSPVVLETTDGPITTCIEVPHVSVEQQESILKNPNKATHFNPVFVASELPANDQVYRQEEEQFWILAKKAWQGQPVVYYETLLYELLGNSAIANTFYVEVPRCVFNPHKTADDTIGKKLADWGFAERS